MSATSLLSGEVGDFQLLNARVVGGALLLALPSAPDAPLAVLPLASCEVEAAASGGAGGASGLIGWGTLAPPSTALTELRLVSSVHSATLRLPAFIANGAPGELGSSGQCRESDRPQQTPHLAPVCSRMWILLHRERVPNALLLMVPRE